MSGRPAAWLAWSVFTISAALLAFASVLETRSGSPTIAMGYAVSSLGFVAVGALVSSRRPGHPIGWLLLTIGFSIGLTVFGRSYATYSLLESPGSLPGGAIVAWLAESAFGPFIGLFPWLLLLFPTGRLPSPRWSWVAWAIALNTMILMISSPIALWSMRGPDLLAETYDPPPGPVTNLSNITLIASLPIFFTAAVSLVVRWRKARGEERQQLKWLAYGTGLLAMVLLTMSAELFLEHELGWLDWLFLASIITIPVAIGIAILRYRLYDIDLVINRTLVYATLTVLLGLVYVGSVVVLGGLLRPLAGSNDLAVAGSTLAVAALFSPARRRIQAFVDRRFYRSRYDAARTVEAFSSRLRDEVDLDTLSSDLQAVVRETLQPASVSVWLRREGRAP